jgi:hypothetical protein
MNRDVKREKKGFCAGCFGCITPCGKREGKYKADESGNKKRLCEDDIGLVGLVDNGWGGLAVVNCSLRFMYHAEEKR